MLLSASTRTQVMTRQDADRPHNAFLLRADIHSLFDDYQWSIWVC
jgi:HNH endonuclease